MIFLILIFGLILRLISINQSLWIDEATSASTVKMSLSQFFGKFMPGDFHPPLYYLALRVWGLIFGTTEVALRSLSIVFGLATIYLVYLIGKKLVNKEIGIVASLFLATSGLHIYYSQEARMYVMSAFLVTVAIFSFVKILEEKSRVVWFILYAIIIGMIGLTDYLPLLILIPIWIFVILVKPSVAKSYGWRRKFILSHIVLVTFALLWSPIFIKQLTSGINVTNTSPSWVAVLGKFSVKDILLIPVKFMIGRVGFDNKYVYAGFVGIVSLIFGFLFVKSKKYFKELKLVYLWLFIPVGLALIVSFKIPVLNYFRFLFVLPAFYLILSFGANAIRNKKAKVLFITGVISINLVTSFMYLTNVKFQREDWRSTVNFIENNKARNSAVIFPADSQMEAYKYYAPGARIYGPQVITNNYSSIWLIRYAAAISDPNDTTRLRIEGLGYSKVKEYDFNGVTVWKYNEP